MGRNPAVSKLGPVILFTCFVHKLNDSKPSFRSFQLFTKCSFTDVVCLCLEVSERLVLPGVALGLAWTPLGGEIMFVEASRMEGDGQLTLTGQLGDVMKESAHLAISWLRTNATKYHLSNCGLTEIHAVVAAKLRNVSLRIPCFSTVVGGPDPLEGTDIHLHFPAGAVTKDGPSAGVTIVTCLASLFSGRLVRSDIAMTGEITLRGLVLPVSRCIKQEVKRKHVYSFEMLHWCVLLRWVESRIRSSRHTGRE